VLSRSQFSNKSNELLDIPGVFWDNECCPTETHNEIVKGREQRGLPLARILVRPCHLQQLSARRENYPGAADPDGTAYTAITLQRLRETASPQFA
jgi:hypothetical protein